MLLALAACGDGNDARENGGTDPNAENDHGWTRLERNPDLIEAATP